MSSPAFLNKRSRAIQAELDAPIEARIPVVAEEWNAVYRLVGFQGKRDQVRDCQSASNPRRDQFTIGLAVAGSIESLGIIDQQIGRYAPTPAKSCLCPAERNGVFRLNRHTEAAIASDFSGVKAAAILQPTKGDFLGRILRPGT